MSEILLFTILAIGIFIGYKTQASWYRIVRKNLEDNLRTAGFKGNILWVILLLVIILLLIVLFGARGLLD